MVTEILKRDRAEEFHFDNRTARNYKPFRLTTDYKLRVLLLDEGDSTQLFCEGTILL